jgi:Fe-S oxidoreductase
MLPQGVGLALKNVLQRHNPFGLAHADRLNWASGTPIKNALEERADALLFACCLSCYDPRGQTAAQAILRIMQSTGVEVGTLGSAESCCGSEVRRMGEVYLYDEMAEELTSFLEETLTDRVVTISPHCLDAFMNHYPDIAKPTAHYTQYLADLLKDGRLGFGGRCDKRITYHDPCYLGIQNGIFEAPRTVIRSIPGVELVEMRHHHDNSWCCGGGGGRMWHEADIDTDDAPGDSGSRMSHARVREAIETGAEVIATACPFCLRMLDDAVGDLEMRDRIEVLDIAELVVSAL